MKIGYIILCHKDPELVSAIANKVTLGTSNVAIIHVDLKSDIAPFEKALELNKQVEFLKKRTSIYWGGFSSIVATMDALEKAKTYSCDRYVLLQGCDYPLHSNEYIAEFFEKYKTTEFLKAYNITKSPRAFNYMKCYGFHIYDGVDRSKVCLKTVVARLLTAINKVGLKYRKGYYYDDLSQKKYDIYWGWGHFALTHNCVEYILNVYNTSNNLNKYFQHIFPADETYLQTIVYNSSFRNNVVDGGPVDENEHSTVESMLNLTYFEYPDHVVVFESVPKDDNIINKYLYIRKVTLDCIKRGELNE